MNIKIVITLDGQVSLITQEGTFAEGEKTISDLLANIKVQGTDIKLDGPMEQHRHGDDPKIGTHTHTHAH